MGVGQSITALARIQGPLLGLTLNKFDVTYPYWTGAAIMAFGVLLTLGLRRGGSDAEETTLSDS